MSERKTKWAAITAGIVAITLSTLLIVASLIGSSALEAQDSSTATDGSFTLTGPTTAAQGSEIRFALAGGSPSNYLAVEGGLDGGGSRYAVDQAGATCDTCIALLSLADSSGATFQKTDADQFGGWSKSNHPADQALIVRVPGSAAVGSTFEVGFAAYDSVNGFSWSGTRITVAVTAASTTNGVPSFDDGDDTTRSVDENTPADQNIGDAVSATDPNSSDILTYSMSGDHAASFNFDNSDGQIKTNADLDYETTRSYTLILEVHDGKDADGNDDSTVDDAITVTISINNVEEAGQVSFSDTHPEVNETLVAGLTDPDGGVTGANWQWASSPDGSSSWADITAATSDNYQPVAGDIGNYLRATVTYTDAQASGKTAQSSGENPVSSRD